MSKVTKADLLETFEYLVDGRRCGFGGWLATKSISHNVDTIRALIERHGDNGPGEMPERDAAQNRVASKDGRTYAPGEDVPQVPGQVGQPSTLVSPGPPSSPDQPDPRPTREEVEKLICEALDRIVPVYRYRYKDREEVAELLRKALFFLRRAVEPRPAPLPAEIEEALATIEHSLAAYERRFGEDDADTRDALATLRRVLARRGRE